MTQAQCCVCRRTRPVFRVLTLQEGDKEAFRRVGKEPPETLTYCQACWTVSIHRQQGPKLFKGLLQLRLQHNGMTSEEAEKVSRVIEEDLVKRASKSPLS